MNVIMDLEKEGRLKRNFWCEIHLQCWMQCWWLFRVLWTWDKNWKDWLWLLLVDDSCMCKGL